MNLVVGQITNLGDFHKFCISLRFEGRNDEKGIKKIKRIKYLIFLNLLNLLILLNILNPQRT